MIITEERDRKLNNLSSLEVVIGRGLIDGKYQSLIAQESGCPKASVNRIVKSFERMTLISPRIKGFSYKGRKFSLAFDDVFDNRRKVYDVSSLFEAAIEKAEFESPDDCMCTVHNVGVKVAVTRINGDAARKKNLSERIVKNLPLTNPRNRNITFVRTYQPRGPKRHVFSVETSSILCSIVVHGNTITAQWSTGAKVRAKDPVSAREIVEGQVIEALREFLTSQREAGISIEHTPPKPYTQPHYTFASKIAKYILDEGGQLHVNGVQIDGSPVKKGLDYGEIEIHGDGVLASKVDQSLRNAFRIESIIDKKLEEHSGELIGNGESFRKVIAEVVTEVITNTLPIELGKIVEQKIEPLMRNLKSAKEAVDILPNKLIETIRGTLNNSVPVPLHQSAIDYGWSDGRGCESLTPWMGAGGPPISDMSEIKRSICEIRSQIVSMFSMVAELLHMFHESQSAYKC